MSSLSDILFFRDAADLDLGLFERRCAWRSFEQGQTILDFEEASTDVYFLLSGDVRVQLRTPGGKELILADLRAGEFFGELSAIDGTSRSANVTALTRAAICIVAEPLFREILAASPALSARMMQLLARRVRELNNRLLEHTVLDIRHSLYAELLRLSAPRPGMAPARVISPPPFHHELASRIGCRREQVTRELGAMQRDGLLARTRGALILPDPDGIRTRIGRAMQQAE